MVFFYLLQLLFLQLCYQNNRSSGTNILIKKLPISVQKLEKNSGIPAKKSVILVPRFVNQVPTLSNQPPTLSLKLFVLSPIVSKKPIKALETFSAMKSGRLLIALSKSVIPLTILLNQPELSFSVSPPLLSVSVPLSPLPVSPPFPVLSPVVPSLEF